MTDAAELIPPHTRALMVELADRLGMTEWPSPPDTLMAVGDGETFYELVRDGDQVAFLEVQRGHRVVQVRFAEPGDAIRYLTFAVSGRYPGRRPPAGPTAG